MTLNNKVRAIRKFPVFKLFKIWILKQLSTKKKHWKPQSKNPTKINHKEPPKNKQRTNKDQLTITPERTQREPKMKPPKNPQRSLKEPPKNPKRTKKKPSKTKNNKVLDSQLFISKPHNQLCPTCSKHMKSKFRKKLAQKNDWQVTGVHLHVSNLQL